MRHDSMAKKAKYDWGKSRDGRYQKFETRISTKLIASVNSEPYADSGYIDIAQCLSMINRKLVRQGQVFKVKNMKLYSKDESPVTTAKVGVLPRTWVMFNAYKKARSLWLDQARQAFSSIGEGNMPKYLDFKVLMDEGHILAKNSGSDLLLPMTFDESLATMTDVDWDYSQLQSSSTTSDGYYLHMLGRHLAEDGSTFISSTTSTDALDSAGLIFAYQESRGISREDEDQAGLGQQDGQVLVRGPFARTHLWSNDQMDDVVMTHAADNDGPPYDANEYPGAAGELKEATTVWTGKIPQKQHASSPMIPQFEAPLGLIRLEVDGPSALSTEEVEIHFDTEIIGTC